ncbi:DUF4331 domain-containing protein [Nitrosococcus watsonii]|uniref:DUF4331 domain-containing protein n=1 Tax=Nitrosococcus watsoni (strain C-113) TaxID=105559 RepID=D8K4D8_NITWC|nr:DUF4331 domain-containing protein [Nitrosococcus watsonii]ADJ27835.1 conserved hypothetical protein [Nitrosococcus watsonii C-113]
MKSNTIIAALTTAALLITLSSLAYAASHREAPLTALDEKADITDFFAFVSYDDATKVTLILSVDPLLEPGNGPNYFPFDPEILYAIRIDNDKDAIEDVTFEVQFQTEIRAPNVFTGFVGTDGGIAAPENSPAPVASGTPLIPPAITTLEGPGSEGLSLRQTYTVTLVKGSGRGASRTKLATGLIAVPSNVGPRTMPDYDSLAIQGIHNLGGGVQVFAGTVEDPFYIDLGAAFDTFNFRESVAPGVLSAAQDANDNLNFAPDEVAGYNVNVIAIEVPITLLTADGALHAANEPEAVIGTWGTTSRPRVKVYSTRPRQEALTSRSFVQIQRMGNPLINELIIGTGFKNEWSRSAPANDDQFADFALDPLLARVFNALTEGALAIPAPPRTDLLPLVQYMAPICPGCTKADTGPIADLLRLNTAIPPTAAANRSRLGFLADDTAGFPNGRRVSDDVTDIAARVVAGGVLAAPFPGYDPEVNGRLGDGVNSNDTAYQETFPYVGFAQSGRNSRHIDPNEMGCDGICPED